MTDTERQILCIQSRMWKFKANSLPELKKPTVRVIRGNDGKRMDGKAGQCLQKHNDKEVPHSSTPWDGRETMI